MFIKINGTFESEPLFSKERMNNTLTSGYFTILGNFSKYKDGVRLVSYMFNNLLSYVTY